VESGGESYYLWACVGILWEGEKWFPLTQMCFQAMKAFFFVPWVPFFSSKRSFAWQWSHLSCEGVEGSEVSQWDLQNRTLKH
jgi:hypothetical protein